MWILTNRNKSFILLMIALNNKQNLFRLNHEAILNNSRSDTSNLR